MRNFSLVQLIAWGVKNSVLTSLASGLDSRGSLICWLGNSDTKWADWEFPLAV